MFNKFAILIGTTAELYEYSLFGYFAPELGKCFFPNSDVEHSIIYTFLIFSIAYLIRPIGGIIFSHYSDRYGRKKILFFSLSMMILSTCIIGISPSFPMSNLIAPIVLFFARIVQGLAISGEFITSMVYVIEGTERKGLYGSLVFSFGILGMLGAILIHNLLSIILTPTELSSWGWRIPFIISLPIFFLAYYIRAYLLETSDYLVAKKLSRILFFPLRTAITQSPHKLLFGFILTFFSSTIFYICFIFMPIYLNQITVNASNYSLVLNTFLYMCALPIFGYFSDQWGKLKILTLGFIGVILLIFPFYLCLSSELTILSYIIIFSFPFTCAAYIAPIPSILYDLYDTNIRNSSISLVYNTSIALSGGIASMIIFWILNVTHLKVSPAIYIVILALIIFSTLIKIPFNNSPDIKHDYI